MLRSQARTYCINLPYAVRYRPADIATGWYFGTIFLLAPADMTERLTLHKRSSGVLLHVTSLPGSHGVGDLGPAAYGFADFLAKSRQTWWQMLPIGPAAAGNSPYTSFSAFAGSPLLISLEPLAKDGLLNNADLTPSRDFRKEKVKYGAVERFKSVRLERAFTVFEARGNPEEKTRFESFCSVNDFWLSDYALFCVLKELHQSVAWMDWAPEFRSREPGVIERVKQQHAGRIRFHKFMQYEFSRQWHALHDYCRERRIGLMGDIPIYVAHDSAEVWAHPDLFCLDAEGRPTVVSGVPPDYFSKTGQLWGTPIYRWDAHRERGYGWWIQRFRVLFDRFDAVRLDHFIGFQNYWEIPGDARTAEHGRWVNGPSDDFFRKVRDALGQLEFLAEDLGVVTEPVVALRDRFGFPGMRVLQFAFAGDPKYNTGLPHHYSKRCAVYTGTHDNETTAGWFKGLPRKEREFVQRYAGSDGKKIHWDLIRLAWMSVADVAVVPAQDLLGLGNEARMNIPATVKGNWEWRLADGALNAKIADKLGTLTEIYGRKP